MNDPINKKRFAFPRHWKGYVAIKFIVLIFSTLIAFYLIGWI